MRGHSIASSGEFSIVRSLEYKNIIKEILDYIKYSHRSTLIEAFHFLTHFEKIIIEILFSTLLSLLLYFSSILTIYF